MKPRLRVWATVAAVALIVGAALLVSRNGGRAVQGPRDREQLTIAPDRTRGNEAAAGRWQQHSSGGDTPHRSSSPADLGDSLEDRSLPRKHREAAQRTEALAARAGIDLRRDAQGNYIPEPPAEYRGTAIHWRLKFPFSEDQLAGLIRNVGQLGPRDRKSVFQKVRRNPSPILARAILGEVPRLPKGPDSLFCAASALVETAKGTRKLEQQSALPRGSPTVRDQTSVALSLLARKVTSYGDVMAAREWSAVHGKLASLAKSDPGILDDRETASALEQIRLAVRRALGKAIDNREGGYLGGSECFDFAHFLGGEEVHEALLESLREWDTVAGLLGHESDVRAAFMHIVRCLLDPPCEDHGREAADLISAICRARKPDDPIVTAVRGFASRRQKEPDEYGEILVRATSTSSPDQENSKQKSERRD